ncbi:MAG: hypothetical protein K0S47_428 [Herbinix sp.]|jgi:hypothetical protein|nr:hypothetical protein [Herbinix sp.]
MGIIDYIQTDQKKKTIHPIEKVRLKKPILNLFLGDFSTGDIRVFMNLLDKHIGTVEKIQFCQLLCKGMTSHYKDDRFQVIKIMDVAYDNKYGVTEREMFAEKFQNSPMVQSELKRYINRIYNCVAQYQYQEPGRIRINLIIKAEDPMAAVLKNLIQLLKNKLEEYFPEYVYLDVYCILDEFIKEQYDTQKNAYSYLTLKELGELSMSQELINNVFCLSNKNSQGVLYQNCMDKIMSAIAYVIIMKDGISAINMSNSFQEDRLNVKSIENNRTFFSMGYLQLEKQDRSIELVLLHQILKEMQGNIRPVDDEIFSQLFITEESLKSLCKKVGFREISSEEIDLFYPIIRNHDIKPSDLVGMTNREALGKLFGTNLEIFYELNFKCDAKAKDLLETNLIDFRKVLQGICRDQGHSIYEIYHLLSDENKILAKLNKMVKDYTDITLGFQNDLKRWLGNDVVTRNIREKMKGTKEPIIFYSLAVEYINLLCKKASVEFKLQVIKGYLSEALLIREKYEKSFCFIQNTQEELEDNINLSLDQELTLRVGNLMKYYSYTFSALIRNKHQVKFQELNRRINQAITEDGIDVNYFYQLLVEYAADFCEEDCFKEDFTIEMVKRLFDFRQGSLILKDQSDVFNLAYGTILDNQEFYLKVVQSSQLNKHICFFANENNAFIDHVVERMQQDHRKNQISIFYEHNYNSIDMIYLVGCFEKEQIGVYHGIWKSAYEELCSKGK